VYESQKKNTIISIHNIKRLFLNPDGVFTARYELNLQHAMHRGTWEYVYQLSIYSTTEKNQRKPWWKQQVQGPSTPVLTSCQQSGIHFWPTRQKN